MQLTTVESVYRTWGTNEPNLWEVSYSLGVKRIMTSVTLSALQGFVNLGSISFFDPVVYNS